MIGAAEREVRQAGLRLIRQSDWMIRYPDLVQGITARDPELEFPSTRLPTDKDSGGAASDGSSTGWSRVLLAADVPSLARCKQVHGAAVAVSDGALATGVNDLGEADALVTASSDVVLAITVADCVPAFMLDPQRRVLGLAHAGWRGAAAGVVESTARRMLELGADLAAVQVHLGPAICGACYEVGPEVPAALGGLPEGTRHVDLRAHIVQRLARLGVGWERVTTSDGCTRCDSERFFSYRGGDRGRRMCAFLGWASR